MSAFSRSTFNAGTYLAYRASYPPWVWQLVSQYHATGVLSAKALASGSTQQGAARGAQWNSALDLGCGPGIATIALLPYFQKVTGVDPSDAMIVKAIRDPHDATLPPALRPESLDATRRKSLGINGTGQLGSLQYLTDNALELKNYLRENGASSADDIPEAAKVDMIIAGQAAHWLTPYTNLFPLLDKLLRPKGSIVFLGYSEFFLPAYPSLNPLVSTYSGGKPPPHEDDSVGEYWQRPGRTIVEEGLTAIPWPWEADGGKCDAAAWDEASAQRRIFSLEGLPERDWDSSWASQESYDVEERRAAASLAMNKVVDWDGFIGYLRTWSALHSYLEQNPDDGQKYGGGKQDIAARFARRIKEGVLRAEKEKHGNDATLPEKLEIRWPLHVYAVKKR